MLDGFFSPGSVAIVGASKVKGKVGYDILENIINGGFTGDVVPINPTAAEILGKPCFKDAESYGKPIDLGIICLPRDKVVEAIKMLARGKVKSLIIIATGFREEGPDGALLERSVVEICKRHNIRFLGPNCLGIINTEIQLNASFAGQIPPQGSVSFFSQSGALCAAMLDQSSARDMGIAKVVSIGNKTDIDENDVLSMLAEDEQTKVIVGYLEDISDGNEFVKVAEEAATRKPVIILKSGTTEAGLRAAASHTGVLASSDTAFAAAFKRAGVVRADSFEALFDYAAAFSLQPVPQGKRVVIITNTGGAGTIAADAIERSGMEVVTIDGGVTSGLRDKLPRMSVSGNGIQVMGDADPGRYLAVLESCQKEENVDAILLILVPGVMTYPAETVLELVEIMDGKKPVLAVFMGGHDVMPAGDVLHQKNLPVYDSPERAVEALRVMSQHGQWQQRPPRLVTRFKANKRRVERIISRKQRLGMKHVGEVKGKDILQCYGFHIPAGGLAASAEEAAEIAERIGFPVALKISSAEIQHKSDLGGVQLNIYDSETVADGFELMLMKVKRRVPEATINGVYVERMINKGIEVIIGMSRDPLFGPMLMFGLGGIFVEVMKDVTFHLAPITYEEATQMLKATRSYSMLLGQRGQHELDIAAIANGLQRISQLTTDFPEIVELDINPFIVGEPGTEPMVADATMTLAPLQSNKQH